MRESIFTSLVGIALLAGCGQASDNGHGGTATVSAAPSLALEGTALAQGRSEESEHRHRIVGAWLLTDPADSTFTALNTFTSEGESLIVASPPPVAGGQGVWTRIGHHEFLVTFFIIVRNPMAPTQKHSAHLTLSDDGNSFTASDIAQACDAAGENCVFLHSDARNGRRIQVEDLQ